MKYELAHNFRLIGQYSWNIALRNITRRYIPSKYYTSLLFCCMVKNSAIQFSIYSAYRSSSILICFWMVRNLDFKWQSKCETFTNQMALDHSNCECFWYLSPHCISRIKSYFYTIVWSEFNSKIYTILPSSILSNWLHGCIALKNALNACSHYCLESIIAKPSSSPKLALA